MSRETNVARMQNEAFDLLVIGGGATGAGIALDAATRGLRTALVERDDYSAGTSSRSTKLIHGGVRYLEQAVKRFDRSQFNLVRDALKERAVLLRIAPHLAKPLPILTPIYSLWEVPYYTTGLKIYDRLAGRANLHPSRFVGASTAKREFPQLKSEGLRGAVIYYDGQFDDARMNVEIALTAQAEGAAVANHTEVVALLKTNGRISGATLRDRLDDRTFDLQARAVINATGPFADAVRRLDDPAASPMLSASSGIHIILHERFSPPETGLLIPQTEDGRVLFLLPWLGYTLVGTTDHPAAIEEHPRAAEDDITYVLRHLHQYFETPATRNDVLAAWSGLRPLVSDPKAADTAQLSRDHIINESDSGLLTIAGGKWTTYRKMALDAVDTAIDRAELTAPGPSRTETLPLIGARDYHAALAGELQEHGLDLDIAAYLARAYGSRARAIARAAKNGLEGRLVPGLPYIRAEVPHAANLEHARTVTDFLARRTRLGFLDTNATLHAIPAVAELLAQTLDWTAERRHHEETTAREYFRNPQPTTPQPTTVPPNP